MAPVRTCIGCRMRSTKTDLLRLVVMTQGPSRTVMPDPRGTAPGRGAHLHPTEACLDLAERRRAFGRALRVAAPLDTRQVREYVDKHQPRSVDRPGNDKEAEQSLMNRR